MSSIGIRAVYGFFRSRLLQKRIISLTAAYAIALSGLIANFGGAQMAAAAQPGAIICHTDIAGQPAPATDNGTGSDTRKICDDCCVGCLMHAAALPPPPVTAIAMLLSAGERIAPFTLAVFVLRPETKSHRSRAPPLMA
jgi:hypothetical protein